MSTAVPRRRIARTIALWSWFLLGAFIASNLVLGAIGTLLVALGEMERPTGAAVAWADFLAYFFAAWVWCVAVLKVKQ